MNKCNFLLFKQSPLSFALAEGLRILYDVIGGLILSSDNPLDFHEKILLSFALTVLKYLCIG